MKRNGPRLATFYECLQNEYDDNGINCKCGPLIVVTMSPVTRSQRGALFIRHLRYLHTKTSIQVFSDFLWETITKGHEGRRTPIDVCEMFMLFLLLVFYEKHKLIRTTKLEIFFCFTTLSCIYRIV